MTLNDYLLSGLVTLTVILGVVLMYPPRCERDRVIEMRYMPIPRVENL